MLMRLCFRRDSLCLRPHNAKALSDAFVWPLTSVWRLLRKSGLSREQRGLGRQNWHRGSPRHMWLGHHFQGQKVKGQLVADVLNSQHAGTGATWRINAKILSTCRGRRHIVSPRAQLVSYYQWCALVAEKVVRLNYFYQLYSPSGPNFVTCTNLCNRSISITKPLTHAAY